MKADHLGSRFILSIGGSSTSQAPSSSKQCTWNRFVVRTVAQNSCKIASVPMITQLAQAHQEGRLEEKISHYSKPKLLIIDELGYLPFDPKAAHLFFQLISRRYEKGSVLITSNRPVIEWGEVFGDAVAATAILDRLLHHSQVITIRGESYRLKEKRKSGLLKPLQSGAVI